VIRHPRELRKAIQIAAENIADKTLVEVIPDSPCVSVSFGKLAAGAGWDEYVEYHFRCLHCNEVFWLRAETYHGAVGTGSRMTQHRYATTSKTSRERPIAAGQLRISKTAIHEDFDRQSIAILVANIPRDSKVRSIEIMKNLAKDLLAHTAVLLVPTMISCAATAADAQRDPTAVLNSLADRIYVAGETTGKVDDMVAAEANAAKEIREYIAGGSTDGLVAKGKGKQSPLAAAAYMGYPNVVAALLTSSVVRAHIDDADEMGVTPWIAANLSMRQSLWACNPAVVDNPFKLVPMLVTQPYYTSNPTPPYKKTRELLEEAGASSDIAKAKEVWLANCKNETEETRTKVQASTDMQQTVQELGAAGLTSLIIKPRKRAAETQNKQ